MTKPDRFEQGNVHNIVGKNFLGKETTYNVLLEEPWSSFVGMARVLLNLEPKKKHCVT